MFILTNMDINTQKEQILEEALKNIPFDGWVFSTFEKSANDLNLDENILFELFPNGNQDIIRFYSQWIDQKMIEPLKDVNIENLKVRDRIRIAIEKRIDVLSPYKESTHLAFKKLTHPKYAKLSTSITWTTSDIIWDWAGDISDDYNHYTKRGLLSGVIGATMIYWLQDNSKDHKKTKIFLNHRIENVLFIGKNVSKIIKPLAGLFQNIIVPLKDKIKV